MMANVVEERPGAEADIRRYIDSGDHAQAERRLAEAMEAVPQASPLHYALLAEIRYAQEDFDDAQQLATKALELDPGLSEAKFQLASALLAKQEVDAAQTLFSELGEELADDARFLSQMAQLSVCKHDFRRAYDYAAEAVQRQPDNSRSLSLQAKIRLMQKRFTETAALARKAVKLDRNNLDGWTMLIRAILATSKKGAADKELRQIRKSIPLPQLVDVEVADYWIVRGDYAEADRILQEVLAAHPNYPRAYQVQTNLYSKTMQWSKAIEAGYKALGFSPYSLSIWRKIGIALAENEEYFVAMGWLHKTLLANPEDILVGTLYARTLHQLREYKAADDLFRQIIREQPDTPSILHLYALLLMDMERHKEAVALIQRAYELAKQDYRIQMNLAMAYGNAGDFEAARAIYRKIMAEKPEISEAFLYYTDITHMADDEEMADLVLRLEAAATEQKAKEEYNFALAKLFEDKREFAKSFLHLNRACSLHKQRLGYNEEANLGGIQLEQQIFTAEFLARFADCGNDSDRPYFVLGMPRSGTTLVEQILSSHPEVAGGGELTVMDSIVRDHAAKMDKPMVHSLADLDCADVSEMANQYLTMTASIGAEARHLVNKFPHNFLHIGLLALMFPNGKIIHLKRNPMATCFSCYKKRFANGHDYSFDLEDLGRYYLAYEALMRHWERVLPGKVYTVEYEKLTSDFETEARKLIAFCGLEWDDACLDFYKNKRAVRTASQAQIRKPIYSDAVSFWRNFEEQLKPLSDIVMVDR
ncbi:MAG: sulfotransferase [Candidatus Thiodiazotropha sp.]